MPVFDPYTPIFWQRIAVAIICGGIIGLERQLRGKPAGIRTSILICLGTEVFVALGALITADIATADPSRVVGQVVTGIGFLGAGVIMAKEGLLQGVTSAAVIWMLAAIGSVVGLGHEHAGVVLAVLTVGVLTGVELLETSFLLLREGVHVHPPHLPFKRRRDDNPDGQE
ncbi:MAG: MgtC/SapB family protein [Proteobacteria bacterium]|nr:MgtC/SapB family protein [Pseudomonadota bacterium]MBU1546835.1 MgtC/SapB family protein [Pseudomonadota bacterium]MBU2618849.1 MgtC/SapB family protein [Pseudomonadota bacterium]